VISERGEENSRELGGGVMAVEKGGGERRKYKRVPVEFPVTYRIRGTTILGRAVNACNEGMMVESYLALKTAFQILGILKKKRRYRLRIEFTHKRTYRTEGEIRHFHLDFSGIEPCRSSVGFFIPKMA
jgi:hypothetical protein